MAFLALACRSAFVMDAARALPPLRANSSSVIGFFFIGLPLGFGLLSPLYVLARIRQGLLRASTRKHPSGRFRKGLDTKRKPPYRREVAFSFGPLARTKGRPSKGNATR